MVQLLLVVKLCEKKKKQNKKLGRVRNFIMIISLLWSSVNICQTHLYLVAPGVWERSRSKCKMMHQRGTVIECSKGTNFPLILGKRILFKFCDIINELWNPSKELRSMCCYYCSVVEQNIVIFSVGLTNDLWLEYTIPPFPLYISSLWFSCYNLYHVLSLYNIYLQSALSVTINILVGISYSSHIRLKHGKYEEYFLEILKHSHLKFVQFCS